MAARSIGTFAIAKRIIRNTKNSMKKKLGHKHPRKIRASIIIPAFNEEKCITDCVKSMNCQVGIDRRDYEIILVDGKSTDRTVALARKAGVDRIIIEAKKRTISFARQMGARAARGAIVIQIDADVIATRTWLYELVVHGLEYAKPEIVAAQGALEPIPSHRKGGKKTPEEVFCKHFIPSYSNVLTKLHKAPHLGPNFAVRKKAFWSIGGYNTSLVTCEDIDLAQRLLKRAGKIIFVPSSVIYFSTRRIKKWGYFKYIRFHISNWWRHRIFGTAHDYYEDVR